MVAARLQYRGGDGGGEGGGDGGEEWGGESGGVGGEDEEEGKILT